jgi:hypothetical protein
MARTAVIAGTATHVSNNVSRRQARRYGAQDQQQAAEQAPPQQYAPPPAGGGDDITAEIERLSDLKTRGLISEEEFAAAKAKALGI